MVYERLWKDIDSIWLYILKTRYGLLNMCVKPTHIALTQTTLSTQTFFIIVVEQGQIANIDVIFS